jgi:hypothetical protein
MISNSSMVRHTSMWITSFLRARAPAGVGAPAVLEVGGSDHVAQVTGDPPAGLQHEVVDLRGSAEGAADDPAGYYTL